MRQPRPFSCATALGLSVVVLASAGCRTRPYELGEGTVTGGPPTDGGLDGARDASPIIDLALADFSVPPDFAIPPDLTVLPDFLPPPDLVRPHYCDGVFVFDVDRRLSFFDPVKLTFTDVATLNCPAGRMASPFSMAVGNDGTAWVEYSNGELFRVDTYTGACAPTMFQPNQQGFSTFGMGFAADAPGSMAETLYIAGSDQPALGRIDLQTLRVSTVAMLPDSAELTGTGSGELWAFFGVQMAHLARVDKQTGKLDPDVPLPQIGDASSAGYAFASFGGDFYVFIYIGNGTTSVWRYRPTDGSVTRILNNTGRHVVGAGVSTCAPGQ